MPRPVGSRLECLASLVTFGIPKEFWPVVLESGELDLNAHHEWLATLGIREKSRATNQKQLSERDITSVLDICVPAPIPKDCLPLRMDTGELELKTYHEWLATMKAREKSRQSNKTDRSSGERSTPAAREIAVPGPMNIVIGRGRHSKSSTRYFRLLELVEKYFEEYDTSERFEKVVIVNVIFGELRRMGCRFVRCGARGLLEQPDDVAMEKISHSFRNFRLSKGIHKKGRETGTAKRDISET
jgi:hypothetical protein